MKFHQNPSAGNDVVYMRTDEKVRHEASWPYPRYEAPKCD